MDEKKYETQKPMMYDIKEHEFTCGKQNGRIQFIQISPNVTLQYCEIRQPHEVGPHRHDYEQIIFIPQGECDFWVDGVPYAMDAGCFMVVPPNAEHYLEAKATCSWWTSTSLPPSAPTGSRASASVTGVTRTGIRPSPTPW